VNASSSGAARSSSPTPISASSASGRGHGRDAGRQPTDVERRDRFGGVGLHAVDELAVRAAELELEALEGRAEFGRRRPAGHLAEADPDLLALDGELHQGPAMPLGTARVGPCIGPEARRVGGRATAAPTAFDHTRV